MNITIRLKSIANKVKTNSYIADIGTDHAYIPIYLIKNGILNKAIGTDNRKGPLEKAVRNLRAYNLQDAVELRMGWGLEPIGGNEVDCAVIAGMGGHLICDILEKDRYKADTIDYFILQPMQAPEVVREYLYNNGYSIYDESLVKENNKIFQIIAAEHGRDNIDDEIYYEIGKMLVKKKDPLLKELIDNKIIELNKVIGKIGEKDSANTSERLRECRSRIKKLEEVQRCL